MIKFPKIRRKYLKWLILLLFILVAVIFVGRYLGSPSQGQSSSGGSKASNGQRTPTLPPTTLESEYFQLTLPTGYKQRATEAAPGLLYVQTLIKPSTLGSLVISIGVKNLPEGGLSADSSFRLRQQNSDRYKFSSQTVDGELVHVVSDSSVAAVVAFWPHAGYLATISISSGLENPSADDHATAIRVLQPLLEGWQWR